MKFKVFYSDGRTPRHETMLEAPDHRMAAEQFVSLQPVSTDRRVNVEEQGGGWSIQQFRPSDFNSTPDKSETARSSDDLCLKVINRYRDGYLVVRALERTGGSIKVSTPVLGILIAIGSIAIGGANEESVLIGLVGGIGLMTQGFIFGMCLSAFAQLLKGVFDNAVHTSPFLDDNQKSDAMSLR